MKHIRRTISVILTLLLIASCSPLGALAATVQKDVSGFYESPDGEDYNLNWSYTASTDTLYLDGKIIQSIDMYDENDEFLTFHLPLWYEENGEKKLFDFPYTNIVFSSNVEKLYDYSLGGDPIYNDTERTVSFEENSKLKEIGEYALSDYNIDELILPESVTKIDTYACSDSIFNYVVLPSGLQLLDRLAFKDSTIYCFDFNGCNLTTINGSVFSGAELYDFELPSGLTTIESYAFKNTHFHNNLVIPASVSTIKARAFQYAHFQKISFASQVTDINALAFNQTRTAYDSIYSYDPLVSYVADTAFFDSDIQLMTFSDTAGTLVSNEQTNISGYYKSNNGDDRNLTWSYTAATDTLYLDAQFVESTDILINGEIRNHLPLYYKNDDNKPVFWAGTYSNIVFGKNVQTLGECCFGEYFLNEDTKYKISFEDGSQLSSVYSYAFCGFKIEELILPDSVNYIEDYAFSESVFDYVRLPQGNSQINFGRHTFYKSEIDEFDFNGCNLNGIPENTFQNAKINSISLPTNISYIGSSAFKSATINCDLFIPDNIEAINTYAFYSAKIKSITFENQIANIYTEAFKSCKTQEESYYNYDPNSSTVAANAFDKSNIIVNALVPPDIDETIDIEQHSVGGFFDSGNNDYDLLWSYNLESDTLYLDAKKIGTLEINGYNCLPLIYKNENNSSVLWMGTYSKVVFSNKVKMLCENCLGISSWEEHGSVDIAFEDDSSLECIDSRAFYGAKIKSAVFPSSVYKINDSAFENCSAEYIKLSGYNGNKAIFLGSSIFAGLQTDEINLSDFNIDEIPEYAFEEAALGSITLPQALKSVGNYAFYKAAISSALVIPDSVQTVKRNAFRSVSAEKFVLGKGLKSLLDYSFANTKASKGYEFSSEIKDLEIGNYAFQNSSFETFNLSSSIKSIGEGAFAYCKNLKTVTADNNCTLKYFSKDMFLNSQALESVQIPKSLETIGNYAFNGCIKLKDVIFAENGSLKYINQYAFNHIDGLLSIEIPNTVLYIDSNAFNGCFKLKELSFESGSSLETIGSSAFNSCTALTSISLPEGLIQINDKAFYNCTSLKEVELPSTVSLLGNSSFANCFVLEDINFPADISNIPQEAFCNDTMLNVALPSTIKVLKAGAFMNCVNFSGVPGSINEFGSNCLKNTGITRLDLSDKENEITVEDSAFADCVKLTEVSFENSSVKSFGTGAFSNCTSLTKLDMPSSVSTIPMQFAYNTALTYIRIPETTKSIQENAFSHTKIKTLLIPESCSSVYDSAFSYCEDLESVVIQSGTTIKPYVFTHCSSLKSVALPETLTKILSNAFSYTAIEELVIPDNVTTIVSCAFECCTNLERVCFSENSKLNKILENAFQNCTKLSSFDMPSSLASIGDYAFNNCALSRVVLPESCTSVGKLAFSNNPLSVVVVLNKSASLGLRCFFFNTKTNSFDKEGVIIGYKNSTAQTYAANATVSFVNISSIDDPENPISEPDEPEPNTFYGRWNGGTWNIVSSSKSALYIEGRGDIDLNSVKDNDGNSKTFVQIANEFEISTVFIGDGITSIPDNFMYSEEGVEIQFVRLPDTLKSIGAYAFAKTNVIAFYNKARAGEINSGLYNSYIPKSVTEIGEYAFAYTEFLEGDFQLSRNLTEISEGLFYGSNTNHVEMYGRVTKINKKAFAACPNMLTLYVPCSVTDIYTDEDPENNAFGYYDGAFSTELWVIGRKSSAAYDYCTENNIHFSESLGLPYRSGKFTDYKGNTANGTINWDYYIEDNQLVLSADNKTLIVDSNWQKYYEYDPDEDKSELIVTFLEKSDLDYIDIRPDKIKLSRITEFTAPCLLSIYNPKEVEVHSTMRKVGEFTFADCTRIESLEFPMAMSYAGQSCFENCTSLKTVRLGYGISRISDSLFSECRKLESVDLGNVVLQTIGEKAFYNCNSLKLVNLSNETGFSEGSIGAYAFYNCVNLQEINIPNNIKTVEKKAFYNCVQAQKLTISSNVTRIEKDAFANLFYCENITLNSEVNSAAVSNEKDIFANLGKYTNGIELNIGNGVETLDCKFFDGLNITNINLGNVQNIENKQYLGKLKTVSVGESSPFTVKDDCLYSGTCLVLAPQSLTQIQIDPSTKAISDYALYGTNAKSITLPSSVEALGKYCFADSKALIGITLSEKIFEIPEGAFRNCEKLRLFNVPESTVSIGTSAFEGCTALISVVFNNSLYSIGDNAFNGCTKLEGLAFPEFLSYIGNSAFANCSSLRYAYIWSTTIGENAFNNDKRLNIFTPVGSDAYRYAREFDFPYSAYTDEDLFFDEWAIKIDAIAGYLGYCEEGGHGNIQYLTVYEADCENDGYIIGVCEYCSEILEEIHVDAKGHDYRIESSIPATATTRGIKVYTCESCHQSITEYSAPLDENFEIQTHTVSGTIELAANKNASSGIAPAKNASIVIEDMVVATTNENGEFSFEIETGAYQARIKYAYGFERDIFIVVKDRDINFRQPIAIIGCDFSKDGIISDDDVLLFQMLISAKKDDPSYLSFVDLNADGYINAKDLLYIKALIGLDISTFRYQLLIIS